MLKDKKIVYELHIEGYSARNKKIPSKLRKKFLAVSHPESIKHLKKLGVDIVQVMPIFDSVGTYWGYDPTSWFRHNPKYGSLKDLKTMVKTLQMNGIKVVLDVVYNHVANSHKRHFEEKGMKFYSGNAQGITGCGNTVDVKNSLPIIMESIRYWMRDINVDGMRFDLATVLGREDGVFNPKAQFFKEMEEFSDKILIAEAWDLWGMHLLDFPKNWKILNGWFRDTVRAGYPYMGSALPDEQAINFITSHDGFTMHDLVTYKYKHNEANGENNQDGSNDPSENFGIEGETDNPEVNRKRYLKLNWYWEQLHNSRAWILIRSGDEVDNTQYGNNNAYKYGNKTSHIKWPE